ncbi:MAG: diguanylate cyclase [Rhodoferax sp.]|nr:diguanylate cyclase [Rhodoferax sp.]
MVQFRDLSIRVKLIVLLGASAAIALSISAIMSLSLTFVTQRSESLRHLQQISDIASDNLTAALAFSDNTSAGRLLGSLRADPHILAAVIHNDSNQQFSAFVSPTSAPDAMIRYLADLAQLASDNREQLYTQRTGLAAIGFDYMYAITPIVFDGHTIGTLTLVSDNLALKEKLTYFIVMQSLISVATLIIIAFISLRLQRPFTLPIFRLIDVIRGISQTKNYAVSVVANQNDEFKSLYTHFNDMLTEIKERDKLLSRLATTDPLTGLANRRHAMDTMETMVMRACRKREYFGLVMFDIDHFKRINDHYGHPVGDTVLKAVSAIMARTAREYDLVARIGGEEFLVLCDNSDLETTRMIAERMRVEIENAVIPLDADKSLSVTVSAGVFAQIPSTEGTDWLLKTADLALYHAKETGRNQVCVGGNV